MEEDFELKRYAYVLYVVFKSSKQTISAAKAENQILNI